MSIKFSVLLPTKNRLELLKSAIWSVREQNYDNWEIIVADNCSQEDIKAIWIVLMTKGLFIHVLMCR